MLQPLHQPLQLGLQRLLLSGRQLIDLDLDRRQPNLTRLPVGLFVVEDGGQGLLLTTSEVGVHGPDELGLVCQDCDHIVGFLDYDPHRDDFSVAELMFVATRENVRCQVCNSAAWALARSPVLTTGRRAALPREALAVSDGKRRILILTPTKSGRRHDKRIADKYDMIKIIPRMVEVWTDTGFQGIQHAHPNTVMPTKATKNKPLTFEQKQNNRIISSIRIVSEHAIGGIKRLKAASDIYRNKLPNLDDTFTFLAAGLWNFHIQQTI